MFGLFSVPISTCGQVVGGSVDLDPEMYDSVVVLSHGLAILFHATFVEHCALRQRRCTAGHAVPSGAFSRRTSVHQTASGEIPWKLNAAQGKTYRPKGSTRAMPPQTAKQTRSTLGMLRRRLVFACGALVV